MVGGVPPPGLETVNVSVRHCEADVTEEPEFAMLPKMALPTTIEEVEGPVIMN